MAACRSLLPERPEIPVSVAVMGRAGRAVVTLLRAIGERTYNEIQRRVLGMLAINTDAIQGAPLP